MGGLSGFGGVGRVFGGAPILTCPHPVGASVLDPVHVPHGAAGPTAGGDAGGLGGQQRHHGDRGRAGQQAGALLDDQDRPQGGCPLPGPRIPASHKDLDMELVPLHQGPAPQSPSLPLQRWSEALHPLWGCWGPLSLHQQLILPFSIPESQLLRLPAPSLHRLPGLWPHR